MVSSPNKKRTTRRSSSEPKKTATRNGPATTHTKTNEAGTHPKSKSNSAREGLFTGPLREAVVKFLDDMNAEFIEKRKKEGCWSDKQRGGGLHSTLEALDTLWTQENLRNRVLAYSTELTLEDIDTIRQSIDSKSPDVAYPLPNLEGDDRSSPETAAVLLNSLANTRLKLKGSEKWDKELRKDFEDLTDQALSYVLDAFQQPKQLQQGGGWGMFKDTPPQLYFTVRVCKALSRYERSELVLDRRKGIIREQLTHARDYVSACAGYAAGITEAVDRYYADHDRETHRNAFSAYGLLALEALKTLQDMRIVCSKEVVPVVERFEKEFRDEPETACREIALSEEYGAATMLKDASGPWLWVQAIMHWMACEPLFYDERWQECTDRIVRMQFEAPRPSTIYMWNRVAMALAAYEQYAARRLDVVQYELRRSVHELINEPRMAEVAYEHINRKLRPRGR